MLRLLIAKKAAVCGWSVLGVMLAGLLSTAASAQPSFRPEAGLDTVTATGTDNRGEFAQINISAQSGTSGENPSGNVSFFVPAFTVSGPVTCLSVTGPDSGAGTAGAPTDAVMNAQTALGLVTIELIDNGGSGRDVMSAIPSSRAPGDCSPFNLGGVTTTLAQGRAVVFDAPPVPTSVDQCKKGGYARFGFKNQGQCIAFVKRERKPK
jgi:hypothetical protein